MHYIRRHIRIGLLGTWIAVVSYYFTIAPGVVDCTDNFLKSHLPLVWWTTSKSFPTPVLLMHFKFIPAYTGINAYYVLQITGSVCYSGSFLSTEDCIQYTQQHMKPHPLTFIVMWKYVVLVLTNTSWLLCIRFSAAAQTRCQVRSNVVSKHNKQKQTGITMVLFFLA